MPSPQYGTAHQRERRKHQPTIASGQGWCMEVVCLMPTRWIAPDAKWDLAHDRTTPGGYLGPAHAACNRSEGAKWRDSKARTASRWIL